MANGTNTIALTGLRSIPDSALETQKALKVIAAYPAAIEELKDVIEQMQNENHTFVVGTKEIQVPNTQLKGGTFIVVSGGGKVSLVTAQAAGSRTTSSVVLAGISSGDTLLEQLVVASKNTELLMQQVGEDAANKIIDYYHDKILGDVPISEASAIARLKLLNKALETYKPKRGASLAPHEFDSIEHGLPAKLASDVSAARSA